MSVLLIVVPLALFVVGLAVGAYIWSASTGQFDDLETPALRMVHEDGDVIPAAPTSASRPPADPA